MEQINVSVWTNLSSPFSIKILFSAKIVSLKVLFLARKNAGSPKSNVCAISYQKDGILELPHAIIELQLVIAKYHDLPVFRRPIIIDLLDNNKSQYFAQLRPTIINCREL